MAAVLPAYCTYSTISHAPPSCTCRYPNIDTHTMAFIKACLQPDPQLRPSCQQLLAMPFMSEGSALLAPSTRQALAAASIKAELNNKRSADMLAKSKSPATPAALAMPTPPPAGSPKQQAGVLSPRHKAGLVVPKQEGGSDRAAATVGSKGGAEGAQLQYVSMPTQPAAAAEPKQLATALQAIPQLPQPLAQGKTAAVTSDPVKPLEYASTPVGDEQTKLGAGTGGEQCKEIINTRALSDPLEIQDLGISARGSGSSGVSFDGEEKKLMQDLELARASTLPTHLRSATVSGYRCVGEWVVRVGMYVGHERQESWRGVMQWHAIETYLLCAF